MEIRKDVSWKIKKFFATIFTLMLCITLSSCGYKKMEKVGEHEDKSSMFVIVEDGAEYYVVYHKKTRVMYAVSDGSYSSGVFTLLVSQDGGPMIYTDDKELERDE